MLTGKWALPPVIVEVVFLARQILKWFYDTSTGTATRAARVVHC
jgi:hypothetical protein